MTIELRLKEERKILRLNQPDFAALGGKTKKTLIDYEKGKTSPDAAFLAAISSAGADVQYILTGVHGYRPDPPSVLQTAHEQRLIEAAETLKSSKADDLPEKQAKSVTEFTKLTPKVRISGTGAHLAGSNRMELADADGADYGSHNDLTPRERALLDNYRHIPDKEDQGVIERMALIAARATREGNQTTRTEKKKVNK